MWRRRRGGAGRGRVPGRGGGGGGDGGRHGRGGGGGAGEAFKLHAGDARAIRPPTQCGRLVSGGAVNPTASGTVAPWRPRPTRCPLPSAPTGAHSPPSRPDT